MGNSKLVTGSGRLKEKKLDLAVFDALALNLPAQVTLSLGDEVSCSIEADDNLLEMIEA